MFQRVELLRERVLGGDGIGQRRSVFLLQAFDQRQTVFHFLQFGWGRVDVFAVGAQTEGEIFQLRFDGVARLQVRLKRRIQLSQFGDPLPDQPQAGQCGLVAVVQRPIGFAAEPLQLLGVGQHASCGCQRFVLALAQRRSLELAHLKSQ